jgi:regulator of replication initiation timing
MNIEQMIEEEKALRDTLKHLKKDIQEALMETKEYKSVYESAIETDGLDVSEKAARAHALKVSYEFYSKSE